MAVSLTFGLPGSGKTTIMCADILCAMKSGRYQNYYCNVHVKIPGVTYIDNDCIGKYELRDCALFIDEATLFADSRNHKEFSEGRKSYFLEHRHRCADIWLYTQQWNGVDLKIRAITDRVFYIRKGFWTGKWLSSCYRVPYDILFPDPKRGNEKLGEIIQGYCKPSFLHRLFARRIWRPKYYRYFDSWDLDPFPPLPERYQPYSPIYETNTKKLFCCVKSFYAAAKKRTKDWLQEASLFLSGLRGSLHRKGKFSKKEKHQNGDPEIYR